MFSSWRRGLRELCRRRTRGDQDVLSLCRIPDKLLELEGKDERGRGGCTFLGDRAGNTYYFRRRGTWSRSARVEIT